MNATNVTGPPTRPRAGVVHPYWTLWEHTAGPTFRADRLALARAVAVELSDVVEPVEVAEIASGEDGASVGRRFAGIGIDVLLVVQTMAVPAAWTMAAIEALTHEQLAHLALTGAADAVLTRAENANNGDIWLAWWRGVDGGPEAMDTSPGMMARTLRPDS